MVLERVYIARHGETEWNLHRRRQGQLDSPLTTEGEMQAAVVAGIAASCGIDAIFSSPLERAYRTASIVSDAIDRPVVSLDALAEVDHGTFAGLSNDEIEIAHPGELARRRAAKYSWRFPDGESYADAEQRATAAIDEVACADTEAPLLVTHEMMSRMLLRVLLDLEIDEALRRTLPHGGVVEVLPHRGLSTLKHASRGDTAS